MKLLISILALIVLTASTNYAQETKTRKEKKQEKREKEFNNTEAIIDSLNYIFNATKANPSGGGGQIDLSSHTAFLKVMNDSTEAYLPFFGRAYSVQYGSTDTGIKFENEMVDYTVDKNTAKLNITISFSARTKNDNYKCNLSVSSSGSATLSISSNNKAYISYYGNVEVVK